MTDKQNYEKQKKGINSNNEKRSKPNELNAFHVEGFVKIFDPNTKETFLESRA